MAIPTALVKLELVTLKGVAAATPGAGNTRYARATFQAGSAPVVKTGRSRPIPDAGGDFGLVPEAWRYEVALDPGTSVHITIDVLEDHGDAGPASASSFSYTISDPWTSGIRTAGSGPGLEVRVTTRLVKPTDAAFLARAAKAAGISGVLRAPQGFFIEFVSIDGLYQPDPSAIAPTPGSKKVAGYISNDNLGRIFTNRQPDGTWARDTQFIDVTVRVTAFNGTSLAAGMNVTWTITDTDDPTNDDLNFHREWGRYVDPNDYNSSGVSIGAVPGDNAGAFSPGNTDEDKLFGAAAQGNARWAQIPGGPAPTASSRGSAQSPITVSSPTLGTCSVRIHCPNVLGTNFVLTAGLTGTPARIPVFGAFTGVMTMWSRIDVEVVRMATAHSVAGAIGAIPPCFVPACVQLDFQTERPVSGPILDKAVMATTPGALSIAGTRAWVDNPAVFTNKGKGGWFFLGAARLANPQPTTSPPALFRGTTYTLGTTGSDAWIEVPGRFPNADFVEITWTDSAGTRQNTSFGVKRSDITVTRGKTRIFLRGSDVTPGFTGWGPGADGSLSHAMETQMFFFPQHQLPAGASALVSGGFGIPDTGATVEVSPPGVVSTSGRSPDVPNARTGTGSFFAGRTVLFTFHSIFSTTGRTPRPLSGFDRRVTSTVVHEFIHAFGMPHKCGFWDWRTPRVKSCCMNYFNTWLVDASLNLVPNTIGKNGNDMCGRHLMEVRRTHLEKNLGLNW